MVHITKRDGRIVPFDASKITNAILKAMHETELGEDAYLASSIAERISEEPDTMTVEEIQDRVEELLMESHRKDVARRYIIYRNERTSARMMTSSLFQKVIDKTNGANIENANANVDEASFGGRKAEAASIIQKEIAIHELMSKDVADAHVEGLIYQHDCDSYNVGMHNCTNIDFKQVLNNGFTVRNGDIRKPQSYGTACQHVAVVCQAQSQGQYGGVGACTMDTDLAPFVALSFKKHYKDALVWVGGRTHDEVDRLNDDDFYIDNKAIHGTREYAYAIEMLEREGRQATEALVHNLNSLESRSGSQVIYGSLGVR